MAKQHYCNTGDRVNCPSEYTDTTDLNPVNSKDLIYALCDTYTFATLDPSLFTVSSLVPHPNSRNYSRLGTYDATMFGTVLTVNR